MKVRQTTAIVRPCRKTLVTGTAQNEGGDILPVILSYPHLADEQLADLAGFAKSNAIS